MPDQRIKGQEVSVILVRGGVVEDTIVDIQSFESEDILEIISKGYLGEQTERKDEIFKGTKFEMELHIHANLWFAFERAIKDRAKRNTPDLVFNISVVYSFPNGEVETVLLPDVKFGAIPKRVTARGDYVTIKLSGECGDSSEQAA